MSEEFFEKITLRIATSEVNPADLKRVWQFVQGIPNCSRTAFDRSVLQDLHDVDVPVEPLWHRAMALKLLHHRGLLGFCEEEGSLNDQVFVSLRSTL